MKHNKPFGIASGLFFWFVLTTISTLFLPFLIIGASSVKDMVTLPKYQAEVIGFDSSWEEQRRENSNGRAYYEDVLMHTPTLRFQLETGEVITRRGNIRSGAKPVIGSHVTVAYDKGKLQIISVASIGLYFGLFVMLVILGYLLLQVLFYSLGWKQDKLHDIGASGLVNFLLPGSMIGMFAAMIYGIFKYFQPGGDMPLWAFIMCVFFAIMLALAFRGIFVLRETEQARDK